MFYLGTISDKKRETRMKAVCVIGHFGTGKNFLDGQTIKTKIITTELQNQLGAEHVAKYDTHGGWKILLKAPFQVLGALKNSENVLIFPAHNGVRVYAPLLCTLNRIFKRKLHYIVIGGWLPEFLDGKKHLEKALKAFDGIYVETEIMKVALEKKGFQNIFVLPNCKELPILPESKLVYRTAPPYRLCTFSRVMKEKGIEDAAKAVQTINEEAGGTVFELDIYGQIDSGQAEWFEQLKASFPEYVRYKGLVPFDKSVDVLKDYFALLFPTFYDGEGFAGTIIDSFAAGVPVIASDWKYNSEIITPHKTGLLFETKNNAALISALKYMTQNISEINHMKQLCLESAEKYSPQAAIKPLIIKIEG